MPNMSHWLGREYFSVRHDDYMIRVSGFDDRAQEHFMLIPVVGKDKAGRRREAVQRIQEAIEAGHEPGEVVSGDVDG